MQLGRWAGWSPLPLSVRDAPAGWPRTSPWCPPRARPSGPPPEAVLEARGVTVTYGRQQAVRGVDLALAEGQVTALMGRNGSGKSSLMWALQGSRKRAGGTVRVGGRDPEALPAEERRRLVGLVPQTAADLLYLETVTQECEAADAESGSVAGTARQLLDRLVPGIDLDRHPRDLSEGQRLALVLAVVLTAHPPVICLDEPTRGLDYPGKVALADSSRPGGGGSCACSWRPTTSAFVAQVADRVVVLAEGEVVSEGPTARVVAESPAFAPQVHKILGAGWLTVDQVRAVGAAG